ncbi:response regulator [Pseudogemmobacter humi]|uniref:Putative transcriptional regulatory protein pdtaR n=1 Tax=Pseudogemmobacter humi TaxID=2483812 RepID=A0A3P5X272_9RHOB|nr:response regulator [Pseudogemmobacter humi]VDC28015.1 putative transcriptional regulatory protein pdtaR [Pseudogemmobacter humi]
MTDSRASAFSQSVARELPCLRRYARALTGSQTSGDSHALAALEAVLSDPSAVSGAPSPRIGLFTIFHLVWQSADSPVSGGDNRLAAAAQVHLSRLTPNSREALLLQSIEGFTLAEIGLILGTGEERAGDLVERALHEMEQSILGKVMIIKDEAIIAMDLAAIVGLMGHQVTGVARTRDEAVALASGIRPDLILADIQLADNSSGIDAANDILARFEVPVIFVTAFPERLLTGERPEPAFLINKPYTEEQVRSAVSQAMFFSSTETLNA